MARPRSVLALAAAMFCGGLALVGSAPGADDAPVPSAAAPIAIGIDNGGGPYVTVRDASGAEHGSFLPYFDFSQGGIDVAAGDVDGDGKANIVTVPGHGGRGEIREFDGAGDQLGPTPLATANGCGTRIAVGDVNGDGKADLVTSYETCGGPEVQVFDGSSGKRLADFRAFNTNSTLPNPVRVAVGDVNGDGRSEIVVGGGPGDPATVEIFPSLPVGSAPQPLRTIDAFGPTVTGGVEVATEDVNGTTMIDRMIAAVPIPTPSGGPENKGTFFSQSGVKSSSFRTIGVSTKMPHKP